MTLFVRIILFGLVVPMTVIIMPAYADIASVEYVAKVVDALRPPQADWGQADDMAPDFIKNKPQIPDASEMEKLSNRVTEITDESTDEQYPTARAVNAAVAGRAPIDDVRFYTIPTTRPSGTPPAGQVFIWFD